MIRYYDAHGTQLEDRDFIELQWNRRWNAFGEFILYLPARFYDPAIKYIQLDGRPETGIVQKIVYQQKTEGAFVTLSGYFLEALLNWGQLWKDKTYYLDDFVSYAQWVGDSFYLPGNSYQGAALPEFYSEKPQLWRIEFASENDLPNATLSYEAMQPFGDVFLNLMNSKGCGLYATPLWNPNHADTEPWLGIEVSLYTGTDRRDSVFFGSAWADVDSVEYARDESGAKAQIIVTQEINDEQKASYTGYKTITTPEGSKSFISTQWIAGQYPAQDEFDYQANFVTQLGATYPMMIASTNALADSQGATVNQMYTEAQLAALNNTTEETVAVNVIQNRFHYLVDYDLGDTCSIVIDEIEKSFSARIVEIYEVHSSNKVDVQIVLGTPRRQSYKRRT